jgi:hypothetical protein
MIEEKLEQGINKMVNEGKFPKFIYLNVETMKKLAFEIRGDKRVVMDMKEEKELSLDSFRSIFDRSMRTAYFRVDSTLTDGEIRITEEEIQ